MDAPRYYTPYQSDNEDDKKTDYDTDTDGQTSDDESTDYEDPRIRREEDPRYAMLKAPGPSFSNPNRRLEFEYGALSGSNYLINTNVNQLNSSLLYVNTPKATKTTLLSMKSSNRDRSVYPTDSYFTLKTPRIYKNVTKFELVQMNFPNFPQAVMDISGFQSTVEHIVPASTVLNCLSSCFNSYFGYTSFVGMGVYEAGRVNEFGNLMYLAKGVVPNIYNTNTNTRSDLPSELNKQFNNTPTFNLITYDQFKQNFQVTGDLLYLFNRPGTYWGNALTDGILENQTISQVASYYFPINSINTVGLSDNAIFSAYYYPVMKDMLATKKGLNLLNTKGSTIEQMCFLFICNFLGLENPLYYNLLSTNQDVLNRYRNLNTYLYQPVNNYIWSYNTRLKQYSVYHNKLSVTLQNEVNTMYTFYKSTSASSAGLNLSSLSNLTLTSKQQYSVFQGFVSLISSQLNAGFGVNNYNFTGLTINSTFSTTMNSSLSSVNNQTSSLTIQYSVDPSGNLNNLEYLLYNNIGTTLSTLTSTQINTVVNTQVNFYPSASTLIGNVNLPNFNYAGVQYNLSNFFITNQFMVSSLNTYLSTSSTISSVNNLATSSLYQYMSTKYSQVFPASYLTNQTYLLANALAVTFVTNRYWYYPGAPILESDNQPCDYQCGILIDNYISGAYYSEIRGNTVNCLAYKLGLYNPTGIAGGTLVSTVGSFSAYSNFNLLLQINTYQSFNNIDIVMNENFKISNQATGQSAFVACKILTAGYDADSTTQTVIKNPVLFPGTLGKLDKLEFRILIEDQFLTPLEQFFPFSFPFTNWDAIFAIEEEVSNADRNVGFNRVPTVQIPGDRKPI